LDLYTESFSEETHSLETFLVVGSTTTNEDANLVELKTSLVLLEGRDDTLESSGNVGEVGNTSSDEEKLAFGVGSTTSHKIDCGRECFRISFDSTKNLIENRKLTDSLGVFVGLVLSGSTRVFTVVGELVSESVSSDSVAVKPEFFESAFLSDFKSSTENSRVDNGSSSSGHHSPNTTFGVQNSQFEGSTSRSIELGDVSFFLGQITTESIRIQ